MKNFPAPSPAQIEPQRHDLRVTLAHWSHWNGFAELLREAGAEVLAFKLAKVGAVYSVDCRLAGVSAAQARAIAARALDAGCALKANVEHVFSAAPAPGARP